MAVTAEDIARFLPQVPKPTKEARHWFFGSQPFVEIGEGIELQMLHVDLDQGLWIVRNRFWPGAAITKHYHTGQVYAVTFKGAWYYAEYPDHVNREGSYMYEPQGAVHTLTIPADQEGPTEVWFANHGSVVNLDENNNVELVVDAATMLNGYRMLCEAQGLDCSDLLVVGE